MAFLVLCLNPAVDETFYIPGFAVGGVYPGQRGEERAGGKGVNCSRVLAQLKQTVHLLAPLGQGGDCIREEMTRLCTCTFLPAVGLCRRTLNIMDPETGRETVISQRGPRAAENVMAVLSDMVEKLRPEDILVLSGSVMEGIPADCYARLARLCSARGIRCCLDCNAALLPDALRDAEYALAKPNEAELCAALSVPETGDVGTLCKLARQVPATYCLVSRGADGAILTGPGGALSASVPRVPVHSTVGCGDASFAGALSVLSAGGTMEEMLRTAMACGLRKAAEHALSETSLQAALSQITIETIQEEA